MELMLVKNDELQLSPKKRNAMLESSYECHSEPKLTVDLRVLFPGK